MKKLFLFAALAAALLAGCSKENTDTPEGGNPVQGEFVSVTLPVQVVDVTTTPSPAMSQRATQSQTATHGAATAASAALSEGFSVSFGDPTPTTATDTTATRGNTAPAGGATATNGPATRTIAQALTNVWVLQFDAAGKNVSTTNTGTLTAGAQLTAPSLQVGTGYTICVLANGVASGLSELNPATLAAFESTMLHTAAVTDAAQLPLAGKLTGVTVVDLGGGKGKISVKDSAPAMVVMNRIHAEVTLAVDFDVTDYTLTGAELYNVPVGAVYGWNSATTTFPDNATAANFGYTSTAAAGLTPLTTSTSGTTTTYKWFIGDNRRGEVASVTAPSDRNSTNAPAYATFARVTLTSTSSSTQKIMYDVYLGSGAVTNFDIKRNMTYTFTAAIKGIAAFQEALIGVDARVSGTGFPIWFTDKRADAPFLISLKSTESNSTMIWGPTTSIPGAQDVYNGKANTTAIMATSATAYPAAKHCRDLGAKYYLPAQAELMLMWIYRDAIPAAEYPGSGYFWSSTETSATTANAWRVTFSIGSTNGNDKAYYDNYVRCVREN